MSTQYRCGTAQRRARVAQAPGINGIDYLEVLDHDVADTPALAGLAPQQTLLVHCFKPLPAISAQNVAITGGVRVSGVKVTWAYPANALPPSLVTKGAVSTAERDWYALLPDAPQVLVVRTDSSGDFSRYTLALVQPVTGSVPVPGFDPQLSQVEFSFKVECPSDFDCRSATECAPPQLQAPLINYLAKDYQGFRQLLLDRLAALSPQWQERNPADAGVMAVEALAYAADQLSYYQDAVATEAYLGTARRRVSVRRHARLLDYQMHDGCNARTWVCLQVSADGVVLPPYDPQTRQGTRFLTQVPARSTLDPTALERTLADYSPTVFEPLQSVALYRAHNAIGLYTWGEDDCCLPKGATRATLLDYDLAQLAPGASPPSPPSDSNRLRLCAGDVLIFTERVGPATGLTADADPSRRHAVRLTKVTPEATRNPGSDLRTPGSPSFDPLTQVPVVEIEWDEADALPFSFCLSTRVGNDPIANVSVALGNAILVDGGLTVGAEPLLPESVPEQGLYRPLLRQSNLTYSVPVNLALQVPEQGTGLPRTQAAAALLRQDPRSALPAVALREGAAAWQPRPHLLEAGRFARAFVVETENDGSAALRFGDAVLGRRPEPGSTLAATYRVGGGSAGNVGAGAIAHVVTTEGGIKAVTNPLPATGGTDPESMEAVRLYAPEAFRRQERAVTAADYAAAAGRHPEVQRAAATLRWTGSWYTMFVTVERTRGRPVDAAFKAGLRTFLERFRLAGFDLEVDAPRFVPLEIAFGVCVAPGYFRSDVRQALLAVFGTGDLPDGRRGFFHPDNFSFGQPVYLSQIVARAMQVPGVGLVDTSAKAPHRFQRWGQAPMGELALGQINLERLEIARLDNDPSLPENGKLEFNMEGGL